MRIFLQFLDPSLILTSFFPEIQQITSRWKLGNGHNEHAFTIFMNSYIITTIDSFYEARKRCFQNLVSEL